MIVALPRPALGAAGIADPTDQRDYVRSLEDESGALRSALGARGVRLSDVVTFTRTFNGFAATVRTSDLADLPSLGVRAQPVRRFYPASSEPARVPGLRLPIAAPPLGGASVAVLDSGVDPGHPLLAGRLDPGYDAVDRDDDPAPATDPRGGRRETSGTALAGILVAAGERVLPIRVAGLQPATRGAGLEDVAISDQLLAGLERAVDPDGDGATDDHVPVAVVGVNSPYAAFERSPEARAVRNAAGARHARRGARRRGGRGRRAGGHRRLAGGGAGRARGGRARGAGGRAAHRPPGRRRRRPRRRAARGLPAAQRAQDGRAGRIHGPRRAARRRRGQPARQARGRPRGRRAGRARRGGRRRGRPRGPAGRPAPPPAARDPGGADRRAGARRDRRGRRGRARGGRRAPRSRSATSSPAGRRRRRCRRTRAAAPRSRPPAPRCRRSPAAAPPRAAGSRRTSPRPERR